MGASWVSFHGRLQMDRSAVTPVNLDGLKIVKSAVSIPMVGNGDIFSKGDALKMVERTGFLPFFSSFSLCNSLP